MGVPSKLAYSVSNQDLHELFSQVGQVQSATIITDKFSGQSKGFGFVEMATSEEAANALRQFDDTELKGRNITVNEAKPANRASAEATAIETAVAVQVEDAAAGKHRIGASPHFA